MKHMIISIVCLLLLIIPWGIYDNYSAKTVDRYKTILDEDVLPSIRSGNWKNAENGFSAIQKDWESYQKISAYFIDTTSVNDVNGFVSKAAYYITARDASHAAAECAYLKDKLEDLHENELLSLENVF